MKVLFISRYVPYQNNSGIGVKMCNLLMCLCGISKVACVYLGDECKGPEEALVSDMPVKNIYIETKKDERRIQRYFKNLMAIIHIPKRIKQQLSHIITEEQPDIIWLEFGYICHLIPFLKKFEVPVFYGSHNSQFRLDYEIWRKNSNLVNKIKMAPAVVLYFLHEKIFFKKADAMLCISRNDIEYYKKSIPETKIHYLPFFFDDRKLRDFDAEKVDEPYICLVGSLRSYQNFEAALFTLELLWPAIHAKKRDLFLYIIGELPPSGSPEYKKLMEFSAKVENVRFPGRVPSVIPFVKGGVVSLAPLLLGSGVRTKIIESVACRVPVVSTPIGAEGLPFVDGDSIFIAESANELSEKVLELVNNCSKRNDMVEKAYSIYKDELSYEVGMKKLSALLNSFQGKP